jgi:G2/mitotic-specific cyclin 1/2
LSRENEDDREGPRVFYPPKPASPADRRLQDVSQLKVAIEDEPVKQEEEADFREDKWDDLDAEDWDDPAMASEYVVDVCHYLKEAEVRVILAPHVLLNRNQRLTLM